MMPRDDWEGCPEVGDGDVFELEEYGARYEIRASWQDRANADRRTHIGWRGDLARLHDRRLNGKERMNEYKRMRYKTERHFPSLVAIVPAMARVAQSMLDAVAAGIVFA